ncbi:hypothetical protein NPIL_533631 [Nephila pilipes]|uniref:Uncharacterized protein n=1 Tax=Nephila pilipes TaxID=299642 RepID=A0A8X6UK76_NEPPI|nr:hypothetical protein NPIL_533631 [Nephila pilipes]
MLRIFKIFHISKMAAEKLSRSCLILPTAIKGQISPPWTTTPTPWVNKWNKPNCFILTLSPRENFKLCKNCSRQRGLTGFYLSQSVRNLITLNANMGGYRL